MTSSPDSRGGVSVWPRRPTGWDFHRLLCDCLRPCLGETARILPAGLPWENLLQGASTHLVTPGLSWCLRDAAGVPPDVADYLNAIFALNGKRNASIAAVLDAALPPLEEADIQPVLLKGAASLATGLYPDRAIRVLGDIDLLVPATRAEEAHRILRAKGFVPHEVHGDTANHHHLAPLHHAETGIAIELHRHVIRAMYRPLLDAQTALRHAVPVDFNGHPVRILRPTDRFAHALAHTQLQDGNYRWKMPALRQMLELAMLARRYREEIDWRALTASFDAVGYLPVLRETCEIVSGLFGSDDLSKIPPSGHNPLAKIRRRLQRRIAVPDRLAWWYADAAFKYANAVLRRPQRIRDLVNRKKLTGHLARAAQHFHAYRRR